MYQQRNCPEKVSSPLIIGIFLTHDTWGYLTADGKNNLGRKMVLGGESCENSSEDVRE